MSEKVMSESVVINRPQQYVWDGITTSEHWKNWYTEGLTGVSPGCQEGATLAFESGQKPVITQYAPPDLLKWGHATCLRLSAIDSSSTEVEYSITVGGMFVEDPMLLAEFETSFFYSVGDMLRKLKDLLES